MVVLKSQCVTTRQTMNCALLGVLLIIYSVTAFPNVVHIAVAWHWPLPWALVMAGLIVTLTGGTTIVTVRWWAADSPHYEG